MLDCTAEWNELGKLPYSVCMLRCDIGECHDSMAQSRPPQILEIYRDYLKPEAVAANRRLEKRAEHLCRTLDFRHPYLTIGSVSGPAEMWYFNGFESQAEGEQLRREYEQNTKLGTALNEIVQRKAPLKRAESTDEFAHYRAKFLERRKRSAYSGLRRWFHTRFGRCGCTNCSWTEKRGPKLLQKPSENPLWSMHSRTLEIFLNARAHCWRCHPETSATGWPSTRHVFPSWQRSFRGR